MLVVEVNTSHIVLLEVWVLLKFWYRVRDRVIHFWSIFGNWFKFWHFHVDVVNFLDVLTQVYFTRLLNWIIDMWRILNTVWIKIIINSYFDSIIRRTWHVRNISVAKDTRQMVTVITELWHLYTSHDMWIIIIILSYDILMR